jgi:hypothetical protein
MPTLRRARSVREAAARDQVAPALQKAHETLSETILPAVRDALVTAREKGGELLDSDAALEAKRRGIAVVQAARGNTAVVPSKGRRWRFGLGLVALGAAGAFGVTLARRYLAPRLTEPVEEFPAFPSGTEESESTSSSTAGSNGTAQGAGTGDGIDLRAGSPTTK